MVKWFNNWENMIKNAFSAFFSRGTEIQVISVFYKSIGFLIIMTWSFFWLPIMRYFSKIKFLSEAKNSLYSAFYGGKLFRWASRKLKLILSDSTGNFTYIHVSWTFSTVILSKLPAKLWKDSKIPRKIGIY